MRELKRHFKPKVKNKHPKALKNLAVAFAIVAVAGLLYLRFLQPHTLEAKQRVELESTQSQLIQVKHKLLQTKSESIKDDQAKQQEIQKLNQELDSKQKQLDAKRSIPTTAPTYAATVEAPAVSYPVPNDDAKAFIYDSESGNIPCKINGGAVDCNYVGGRACGIGQALPCSKLTSVCSLSDYACQDTFFTNYMLDRYGSWNNARAFWIANKWW